MFEAEFGDVEQSTQRPLLAQSKKQKAKSKKQKAKSKKQKAKSPLRFP
ncbi:hypothetical protein H0S68_16155 [Serratia sp. AXJ-M]